MHVLFRIVPATLLASALFAQCPQENASCTSPFGGGNANVFALVLQAPTTQDITVAGFELKTQGNGSGGVIQTAIHLANASGQPSMPAAATSSFSISGSAPYGWYRTVMKPVTVKSGQRFFISFAGAGMRHPICGSGGTRTSHFWHPPTATTWRGPFTSQAWAFRVLCDAGVVGTYGTACKGSNGKEPIMDATGDPKIGKVLTVTLKDATPATPAFLTVGGSDAKWGSLTLPLDLTPLGAPGCSILASGDVILGTASNQSGAAQIPLAIPGNQALVGMLFYDQWLLLDRAANSFGVATSQGLAVFVGK